MPTFTTPDGATLYYTDEGTGTPVLALSGLTRNVADFDYVAPHLRDVRLIRMDYRGRGRSDWTGADTYTIPTEAADALALMDRLNVDKAAILGTSRGGIIAMFLAATARDRLTGVFLNDIGPELAATGLDVIRDYIGRNPAEATYDAAAKMRAKLMDGFEGVPNERWRIDVEKHYKETSQGLEIRYDPALRDAVLAVGEKLAPDLWPLFDALTDLPLALVRGANSNLLTAETAAAMSARRPDMIFAEVSGRGHVPFLDEPEAVIALRAWLETLP